MLQGIELGLEGEDDVLQLVMMIEDAFEEAFNLGVGFAGGFGQLPEVQDGVAVWTVFHGDGQVEEGGFALIHFHLVSQGALGRELGGFAREAGLVFGVGAEGTMPGRWRGGGSVVRGTGGMGGGRGLSPGRPRGIRGRGGVSVGWPRLAAVEVGLDLVGVVAGGGDLEVDLFAPGGGFSRGDLRGGGAMVAQPLEALAIQFREALAVGGGFGGGNFPGARELIGGGIRRFRARGAGGGIIGIGSGGGRVGDRQLITKLLAGGGEVQQDLAEGIGRGAGLFQARFEDGGGGGAAGGWGRGFFVVMHDAGRVHLNIERWLLTQVARVQTAMLVSG